MDREEKEPKCQVIFRAFVENLGIFDTKKVFGNFEKKDSRG